MTRSDASERVKAAALEIGFDAVGIAAAEPLIDPIDRYRDWLEQGNHGMLGWMERNVDKREDVTKIVPGAKSVIVVARNYHTPHQHPEGGSGKISRYAWGSDYHDVVTPMLDRLSDALEEIVPGYIIAALRRHRPCHGKGMGGSCRSGLAGQALQYPATGHRLVVLSGRGDHHSGPGLGHPDG